MSVVFNRIFRGRNLRSFVVLAATLLTFSACESMDRAEAVRSMNSGLEALELGRNVDAIRYLKEAAQLDSTYAEPSYYLGQVYHIKMGELDEAERFYREAFDRDKENPQIAYKLGTVLGDQKKWSEAEGMLTTATTLDDQFAKAWFRLGIAREQQNKFVAAVEAYMKSIRANARMRMDKDDPGGAAYHALGDLYIRFKQYDKALAVYENGIANNNIDSRPSKPIRLFVGKGVSQLKMKKFEAAEASFKQAISHEKSNTKAIFNLAVAHMAQQKTDEAVKGFEEFASRADSAKDEAQIIAAQGFIQQIREAAENKEEKK